MSAWEDRKLPIVFVRLLSSLLLTVYSISNFRVLSSIGQVRVPWYMGINGKRAISAGY